MKRFNPTSHVSYRSRDLVVLKKGVSSFPLGPRTPIVTGLRVKEREYQLQSHLTHQSRDYVIFKNYTWF